MSAHVAPSLTIVVPCYDEEAVLQATAMRLSAELDRMIERGRIAADSRIRFVDDGSRDLTWALIAHLHAAAPSRIEGVRLSRNRGHQNALLAGILSAGGDLVVSIDADLQDDPGAIAAMVDAAASGADVVLGVRLRRDGDTGFKRRTAQGYYRLLAALGVEIAYDHADFRLLSRRAVEALRAYGERNLFLRALVLQLGFKVATVGYERRPRAAGETKYPLHRMLSLALDGVTSFTTRPLRIITALGFAISAASFLLGLWALSASLLLGSTVPGWASTVVPIYLICGVQMVCIGVIGEYVGKIYIETKRRPRYLIETELPAAASDAEPAWAAELRAAGSAFRLPVATVDPTEDARHDDDRRAVRDARG